MAVIAGAALLAFQCGFAGVSAIRQSDMGLGLVFLGVAFAIVCGGLYALKKSTEPCKRVKIVTKWKRVEIGMTESQVKEILGPPTSVETTKSGKIWDYEYHEWDEVYSLEYGRKRPLSLNVEGKIGFDDRDCRATWILMTVNGADEVSKS